MLLEIRLLCLAFGWAIAPFAGPTAFPRAGLWHGSPILSPQKAPLSFLKSKAPAHAPGEVLVIWTPDRNGNGHLDEGERGGSIDAIETVLDGEILKTIPITPTRIIARVKLKKRTVAETLRTPVNTDAGILVVEPHYFPTYFASPNDPLLSEMWALQNSGAGDGTPGADIEALPAWDLATGAKDIVVAVVDSGIAFDHPDLVDNMWRNPGEIPHNGIDEDGNGYVDDIHGWSFDQEPDRVPGYDYTFHGTLAAGLIGARGNNGLGIVGLNHRVSLMALSTDVFDPLSGQIEAIAYAIQHGARVINVSWGVTQSEALDLAIEAARDAGILVIAAAGNFNSDMDATPVYPASAPFENVIAVAATDRNDQLSDFSNFGPETVDLAAPGQQLLTTSVGERIFYFEDFQGINPPEVPQGVSLSGTRNYWGTVADPETGNIALRSDAGQVSPYRTDADGIYEFPDFEWDFSSSIYMTFRMRWEVAAGDTFRLEQANGGGWQAVFPDGGWNQPKDEDGFAHYEIYVESLDRFRFRWNTNPRSHSRFGVEIDNIKIFGFASGPSAEADFTDAYFQASGTTLAAAHVTGAAALILSKYPDLDVATLKEVILSSADKLSSLEGRIAGGRLNVFKALQEARARYKTTLVYPWVSNRENDFESILFANNYGGERVKVTLSARRNGSESETVTREIPAHGFLEEKASSLFPALGSGSGYSVVLTAPTEKIRGGWVTNNLRSASGKSPSQGVAVKVPQNLQTTNERIGKDLVFGYLPLTGDMVSAAVLVNLGQQPTDVSLRLFDEQGQTIYSEVLTALEPLVPFAVLANDLSPASGGDVYMVAESADQLLTGVAFVFNETFGETAIGNVTGINLEGPESGATTLVYPWISHRAEAFESILVANNLGDSPVQVQLIARRQSQPVQSQEVTATIPAQGFLRARASDLFDALGSGDGYAVELVSPSSKIAGQWLTNNLAAASGRSPSLGVAVRVPAPDFIHSHEAGKHLLFGYLPVTGAFASAPVLVNLGQEPADVTLRFFDAQGQSVGTPVVLQGLPSLVPFATLANAALPSVADNVYLVASSNGPVLTGVNFVFNGVFFEPAIGNATAIDFEP